MLNIVEARGIELKKLRFNLTLYKYHLLLVFCTELGCGMVNTIETGEIEVSEYINSVMIFIYPT